MPIFTLGYEGLSPECFASILKEAGVQHVCDARELPLSRKKGFSKSAISQMLASHGIKYEHVKSLGCPRPIRNRYKATGDWSEYSVSFAKYLRKQSQALAELAVVSRAMKTCIICFEANPDRCHRKFVAVAVAERTKQKAIHLTQKVAPAD